MPNIVVKCYKGRSKEQLLNIYLTEGVISDGFPIK